MDVAILYKLEFAGKTDEYKLYGDIGIGSLADEKIFANKTKMMDVASFFGFPGAGGRGWWDERANLPIARVATISSLTDGKYKNVQINSEDVVLVSGMSFTGSSGSPIVLHMGAA